VGHGYLLAWQCDHSAFPLARRLHDAAMGFLDSVGGDVLDRLQEPVGLWGRNKGPLIGASIRRQGFDAVAVSV